MKGWEFFFPHCHPPPPKVSFKELDNRVAIYGMLNHSWKCKNMEALWFDKPLRYMCVCDGGESPPPPNGQLDELAISCQAYFKGG